MVLRFMRLFYTGVLNRDFHSSHRTFRFGRIDSRFLRAFSRLFIGRPEPTPHTPHLLVATGVASQKYAGSWISQTNPALLPSGAITKASPSWQGSASKSVILPNVYTGGLQLGSSPLL